MAYFYVKRAVTTSVAASSYQNIRTYGTSGSTITVTGVSGLAGSKIITFTGTTSVNGLIPGVEVSGTGIGSGAKIKSVTANNPVGGITIELTASNTASVSGTITFYEIMNGDYFLLTGQSTASENGVYLRSNGVNSKIASQPVTNTDSILSILDNQEWKRTGTNVYTKTSSLSAASAIQLAVLDYTSGATKPVPTGYSSFPEQIDLLKILDFSTEGNAKTALADYYQSLVTYYGNPSATNAESVRSKAAGVQAYILTESDYNLLAGAVMNIQLYLKQYLPDTLASFQASIQSFIDSSNEYYLTEQHTYQTFVSASNPTTKTVGGADKTYLWFKEVT